MNQRQQLLSELMIEGQRRSCIEHPDNLLQSCQVVKTTSSSGEWIFGWVMDGRAIQDLFIIHPSAARKERYIGTTLRYFEPKSATWNVTFVDPENGSVATLTGGAAEGGRIVLHSQNKDGKESRWSFDEIRPDSWVFRDEETGDGGKTWRLREEDHMKRRGAPRAHPVGAHWYPQI